MNKKKLSVLLTIASIAFAAGTALGVVMTVIAVRFGEWGRVLVYGVAVVACLEAMILALGKLRNKDKA